MEQGTSRKALGSTATHANLLIPGSQPHDSRDLEKTPTGTPKSGVPASPSYYDIYPERKRTGPYIPKADLVVHGGDAITHRTTRAPATIAARRSRSGERFASHHKAQTKTANPNKAERVLSSSRGSQQENTAPAVPRATDASSSTSGQDRRHVNIAKEPVQSIDDIVRAHSGSLLLVPPSQRGSQRSLSWSALRHHAHAYPTSSLTEGSSYHEHASDTESDHSATSIEQEARTILRGEHRLGSEMSRLSFREQVSSPAPRQRCVERQTSDRPSSSARSSSRRSPTRGSCFTEATRARTRLTCRALVKVIGSPPLQVSFADVGLEKGHPVMVFLGLGASRHLIGLYDELAASLGLRLVCIDRWGIGRTDNVAPESRKILSWSLVVEQVANLLDLDRFSILAHSAGAPFAMAFAILLPHRIQGPVRLLAPWSGVQQESGYRWLRYLPDGVIKTAHAADSRFQGWKLGREEGTAARRPRASTPLDRRTTGRHHDANDGDRPPTPPPKDSSWHSASTESQSGSMDSSRSTLTIDVNERGSVADLLRASHAESARGLVDDLNLMLGKTPWGFAFSDVKLACEVWHGTKDERIPLSSSISLSKEMRDCSLHVVEGAGHSLMTNTEVLFEVFESIRDHASW